MTDRWINNSGLYEKFPDNAEIVESIEPGIWQVSVKKSGPTVRIGLVRVSKMFEFPSKFYSLHESDILGDIKTVWDSDYFMESGKNLGVVLDGTKGTGKTWYTKLIANEFVRSGYPVIIVDNSFEGAILDFVRCLRFDCVILLDEAEKTFAEDSDSNILLKMIDGTYSSGRRLFLLTTNRSSRLNENLSDRPGRIRYIYKFSSIPESSIDEVLGDTLRDKSKAGIIKETASRLDFCTIDILKALVEEVNITGTINDNLNIPTSGYRYVAKRLRPSNLYVNTWDLRNQDTVDKILSLLIKYSGRREGESSSLLGLGKYYRALDKLPEGFVEEFTEIFVTEPVEDPEDSISWESDQLYSKTRIGANRLNAYTTAIQDVEEVFPGSGIVYFPEDLYMGLYFIDTDRPVQLGISGRISTGFSAVL